MAYSKEFREAALSALDGGMSKWEVHKTFKVSRTSLDDWIKLREETGDVKDKAYHHGRKPRIADTAENQAFFEDHKHKSLTQISDLWFAKSGERLSNPTLSRSLKRLGYTRKKKTYLYQERDDLKRAAYLEELAKLEPKQCVYIDEAGIENSLNYAYGWAKKGQRCFADKLGHFTRRVSMIAAYCQRRVFAPMTFTGYCDSAVVETWF